MGVFSLLAQVNSDEFVTNTTYTTTNTGGLAAMAVVLWIFYVAFIVLMIVALWKIFTKAGEAGWKSIIPIWNTIILLKIVGRPWWWLLLLLIPFVNFIVLIIVMLELGKAFGKSVVFSIFGLIIFSVVGELILAFGDAKYVGPAAGPNASSPKPIAE